MPEAFVVLLKSLTKVEEPRQLSTAVAEVTVTLAVHTPASVPVVWFAGQVMVGASASFTVMVMLQVAVFPEGSVAVHATVVVPTSYVSEAFVVLLKSLLTETERLLSAAVGLGTVMAALH